MKRELAGVALLLFAVFLAGSVAAGLAGTPGAGSCWRAHSALGPVGACLRASLVVTFGLPATVLVPLVPAVHALRLFGRMRSDTDRSWMLFLVGVVLLLPVALGLALHVGRERSLAAGVWGGLLAFYAREGFGSVGAWIVLALAASALMVVTLAWNPIRVLIGSRPPADAGAAEGADAAASLERPKRRRGKRESDAEPATLLEPPPEEMPAIDPTLMVEDAGEIAPDEMPAPRERRRKKSRSDLAAEHDEKIAAAIDASAAPDPADEELPSSELLTPPPPRNVELGRRELDAMGAKLKEALRTFRVEAEIAGRTTGPVVTQFEVEPAPGVKVRQIANLANDLALAMRAASIRIVAPIPGRGAVGVEVPNPTSEIVAFRELIESREFLQARAALPIALGKDLEGKPVIADLAKMPHLLIAGATGSGKSVCVNTIITSLVYRHTPRTLRFLMVDPKMVELSVYNTLPHLRHKVITDNRDAAAVLKWAVMEMQERYELLAANGCRNVQDFNRRVQTGAPLKRPKRDDVAFEDLAYTGGVLPYIVVVIDELADLMMTVQGEVETPLAMLAQK
ncbi:MAG TPA: DNA translocase FtsK 4TM domain-containing protein, partial [Gemmatimonadaceae bacterium]